jgi:predicted ferric reductase
VKSRFCNLMLLKAFAIKFFTHSIYYLTFFLFIVVPGLSYAPTSIAFINVSSISRIQWHPFTVTSNSNMDSDKLSVVIKCDGSWSHKLYQILSSPSPTNRLEVSIEGPYGPPSANFMR